ncbi:MAG: aldo/keto reductase [archaeon]|nr:aldo/keto reductase [archaeon]
MNISSTIRLNNGIKMPFFGLGVYQSKPGSETQQAVKWALEEGYRQVDTAAYYKNEEDVGIAVRESGIKREEIFVTTKLRNPDHDFPEKAFNESLKKLGLKYVDLYLIHWPVEGKRNAAWKVLEKIYKEGKAKSIGVSNYTIKHLEELLEVADIVPAVNQVEFSPYLYQKELLEYCKKKGIALEAYAPLTRGERLKEPKLMEIAKKYSKTPAQILIRWTLQHELIVIPKSVHKERIQENAKVFDFSISKEDMKKMDSFNENLHTCWNPTNVR